ncbi:lamin tail domain-containing protein [Nannocystaceae bacterium ST9]
MPRFTSLLTPLALTLATACSGATVDDGGTSFSGSADELDTAGDTGEASCGNAVQEADEACDGSDLAGQTCAGLDPAYTGGTLACTPECGFDESGCAIDPAAPLVRLNEVTSETIAAGPHAGWGDAIELVNAGGGAADLGGASLSDDPSFPADKTYTFPPGTMLAPGEHLVLAQDEGGGTGALPFGLKTDGDETLTLRGADQAMLDQVAVPAGQASVSWCRLPDGTGAWTVCAPTFGETNGGGGEACGNGRLDPREDCDGRDLAGQTCADFPGFSGGTLACVACSFDLSGCDAAAPLVVINELTSLVDDEIELYNAGTATAELEGWVLTDDLAFGEVDYDPDADLEELVFPAGATLAPGAWLVVIKGAGAVEHPFGLADTGDTVSLLDPNLALVDQVEYGDGEADPSYCRMPDGGDWVDQCDASFGISNGG